MNSVAARHGVARVHPTIDDMLHDEDVALVDIAVPASFQPDRDPALEAGKDVICQKPLALDLLAALQIVDRAAQLGRKVAVQQQLRFDEGVRRQRAMIRGGLVGELHRCLVHGGRPDGLLSLVVAG